MQAARPDPAEPVLASREQSDSEAGQRRQKVDNPSS